MKLSIVIPAYNCEKTIRRCLDNLLDERHFRNYEIIIVNDGSSDSTKQICEEYEEKYPLIRLINQKNSGVSSARNAGLDISSGDFIIFIDSDDHTEKNFIETVFSKLKISDEMVLYRNDTADKNNKHICISEDYSSFDYDAIFKEIVSQKINQPWGKIFRTDIIKANNISFNNDISLGEDLEFLIRYYVKINSISCWNDILYHYVYTEGSLTNKAFTKENINDFCLAYRSESVIIEQTENSEYRYLLNKSYVQVLFRKILISGNITENIKILRQNFDRHSELSKIFKLKYDPKTQIKKYILKLLIF